MSEYSPKRVWSNNENWALNEDFWLRSMEPLGANFFKNGFFFSKLAPKCLKNALYDMTSKVPRNRKFCPNNKIFEFWGEKKCLNRKNAGGRWFVCFPRKYGLVCLFFLKKSFFWLKNPIFLAFGSFRSGYYVRIGEFHFFVKLWHVWIRF